MRKAELRAQIDELRREVEALKARPYWYFVTPVQSSGPTYRQCAYCGQLLTMSHYCFRWTTTTTAADTNNLPLEVA